MEAKERILSNEELRTRFEDALIKFTAEISAVNTAYFEAVSEINKMFNEKIRKLKEEAGVDEPGNMLQ